MLNLSVQIDLSLSPALQHRAALGIIEADFPELIPLPWLDRTQFENPSPSGHALSAHGTCDEQKSEPSATPFD
jgi:hypothetical protein